VGEASIVLKPMSINSHWKEFDMDYGILRKYCSEFHAFQRIWLCIVEQC
jgi:hypothetical protein